AGVTNPVPVAFEREKDKMTRLLLPPSGALHRISAIADKERSGSPIRLILQRSRRLCSRSVAGASSCSRRRSAIADSSKGMKRRLRGLAKVRDHSARLYAY